MGSHGRIWVSMVLKREITGNDPSLWMVATTPHEFGCRAPARARQRAGLHGTPPPRMQRIRLQLSGVWFQVSPVKVSALPVRHPRDTKLEQWCQTRREGLTPLLSGIRPLTNSADY